MKGEDGEPVKPAEKTAGAEGGDLVEFEAELRMDECRLVLEAPRKVDFIQRGPETFDPELSAALVYSRMAALLAGQDEKCLHCERGRLVDVVEKGIDRPRFLRRELFCLEGVKEPALCSYNALKKIGIRRV